MTAALALLLPLARRGWAIAAGGCALLAVLLLLARADARHWRARYEREEALHRADLASVQAAAEQARANDIKQAALVKARDDATVREMTDALSTRLAAARADADRLAARLRRASEADRGGASGADLPAVAESAGGTAGAGQAAELDDARTCAENTVKAEGWRAWWQQVTATPR